MHERFSGSMMTVTMAGAAVGMVVSVFITSAPAQAPVASTTALITPWGEPDLQGIWTDETDTPLQRSAKYATQEFFTAAQRAELDAARAALLEEDRRLGGAASWPLVASAQQGDRVQRIGVLMPGTESDQDGQSRSR
jgi:hypothetical protein